jgi:hypothetical protein
VAYGLPVNFKDEWTEADVAAGRYGYEWELHGKSADPAAAVFDQPDQNGVFLSWLTSPYSFYAHTYAKCWEGRDAGKVYATIYWGFSWTNDTTPVGLGPTIANP